MLLHHNECDMLRRIFYVYYLILYIFRFYIYIFYLPAGPPGGGLKKKKKEVGLPVCRSLQSLFYSNIIILTSINIDFKRESLQLLFFGVKKSENQEKISLTLYLFLACPLAGWPEQML